MNTQQDISYLKFINITKLNTMTTYKTAQPRAIKGWTLIYTSFKPFSTNDDYNGTTTFYYQKNTPSKACQDSGYEAQILQEQYFTTDGYFDHDTNTPIAKTFYSLEWMNANGGLDCPLIHDFKDGRGEIINIGYSHVYKSDHKLLGSVPVEHKIKESEATYENLAHLSFYSKNL
tara:strand:+ start:3327 stop:3848 length:522 start_codon:yes stop_codon:yes gene_type:complete